jgi:sterol desaturase/sphingolipid hydroxylase (fatty acid hydroxylase superfamily)
MSYPEPTIYAIPFFLVTLAIEPLVLERERSKGRIIAGHERRDTWASLGMGIGSLIFASVINLGVYAIATALWRHRLTDLGEGALGWAAAMIGWDLAYYWNHRFEHEVRLLWACHVNHHSSRFYNLSTALRQPWTPFSGLLFYPGLALLGVAPVLIMVSAGLNLIYQYWIHTEAIPKLGVFEQVMNTASAHRVHHGVNPEYIDRNHGSIFIIWDRLFGTFAREDEPVVYGLTKNVRSFNPVRVVTHEYVDMARDVAGSDNWRDRLSYVFKGPGWSYARNRELAVA